MSCCLPQLRARLGARRRGRPRWRGRGRPTVPCSAGSRSARDTYAAGQHRGIDIALGDLVCDSRAGLGRGHVRRRRSDERPDRDDRDAATTRSRSRIWARSVRRGATWSRAMRRRARPTGEAEHDVPYVHLGIRVGAARPTSTHSTPSASECPHPSAGTRGAARTTLPQPAPAPPVAASPPLRCRRPLRLHLPPSPSAPQPRLPRRHRGRPPHRRTTSGGVADRRV